MEFPEFSCVRVSWKFVCVFFFRFVVCVFVFLKYSRIDIFALLELLLTF